MTTSTPLPLCPSLDPAFLEREYNNRARVPEHPEYFARWERDSRFVRETLPCRLDLPYGPDPRHRWDLFPAANARGTLVFIHGGYWRGLDKGVFSWLAASYVAAGLNVALPNYRLAPSASIEAIVGDVGAAMDWLFAHGAEHGIVMERVAVSGHSAGGHLVAALFAAPAATRHFDAASIVGGVAISGLYEFEPLLAFSGNDDFRLDAASAARLNLYDKRPTIPAPLVAAVGGAESSEFIRHTRLLAAAWPTVRETLVLPSLDHFSVVDAFCERGQPLYEATLALVP